MMKRAGLVLSLFGLVFSTGNARSQNAAPPAPTPQKTRPQEQNEQTMQFNGARAELMKRADALKTAKTATATHIPPEWLQAEIRGEPSFSRSPTRLRKLSNGRTTSHREHRVVRFSDVLHRTPARQLIHPT